MKFAETKFACLVISSSATFQCGPKIVPFASVCQSNDLFRNCLSKNMICGIWSFHSGEDLCRNLQGCDAV